MDTVTLSQLAANLEEWARELGFAQLGISDIHLDDAEKRLGQWLAAGRHGAMDYMQRHGRRRSRPAELVPGTVRVICVRLEYLTTHQASALSTLADPTKAYIARYALGRDYHKFMRKRLQRLAERLAREVDHLGFRAFVDSAPVLEKPLAQKAGLGWIGKHTLLLHRDRGSYCFLGEIYTNLPLPATKVSPQNFCGTCRRCIDVCPTKAIVAPYQLDARKCISYLTIEQRGPIPRELRPLIGNRVFGCDDCQLVCPWNRKAKLSKESALFPRESLVASELVDLFSWDRAKFSRMTEGNALRRAGYEGFLRNVAVALGNAPSSPEIITALEKRRDDPAALVREHVHWALEQHQEK